MFVRSLGSLDHDPVEDVSCLFQAPMIFCILRGSEGKLLEMPPPAPTVQRDKRAPPGGAIQKSGLVHVRHREEGLIRDDPFPDPGQLADARAGNAPCPVGSEL